MRYTRLLAISCTAVLIGCEPVSEPDVTVPDPSFAKGPVTEAAYGTAYTPAPAPYSGSMRNFSFSATAKDGTAKGYFQYRIHDTDWWGYGEVICMTIVENTAYIGGAYTRASSGTIGTHKIFAVKDNDPGPNAAPDQITYVYTVGPEGLQEFCNNPPSIELSWINVEAGEIVVRGQ